MTNSPPIPFGVPIFPAPHLPPDFLVIADWQNPQLSTTPEWHKVYFVKGRAYAHPNILEALKNDQ